MTGILSWGVPVTGLALMLLAWKRFRPSGVRLAVAGFGVMLLGSLLREILWQVLRPELSLNARDFGLISTAAGAVGIVGLVLIVFAMRRIIAGAELAESHGLAARDSE